MVINPFISTLKLFIAENPTLATIQYGEAWGRGDIEGKPELEWRGGGRDWRLAALTVSRKSGKPSWPLDITKLDRSPDPARPPSIFSGPDTKLFIDRCIAGHHSFHTHHTHAAASSLNFALKMVEFNSKYIGGS